MNHVFDEAKRFIRTLAFVNDSKRIWLDSPQAQRAITDEARRLLEDLLSVPPPTFTHDPPTRREREVLIVDTSESQSEEEFQKVMERLDHKLVTLKSMEERHEQSGRWVWQP